MAGNDPETDEAPPIALQLLGAPQWRRLDGAGGTLAPRDAALLALLAIDGQVARDRLAAWLWPEATSQGRANLSLRQRLHRLRRDCGHPLVKASHQLALLPCVTVDLHAEPPVTEGQLLAGQDFSAFEAFDAWLQAARDALGARQADALAGRAAALEARGALAEAIALTERIVATRPATEHAWRRLMRLHWLRADRAAAIATFERFEREVCRELGLRPSAETLALLDQVERQETTESAPRSALPAALLRPPRLVGREASLRAMAEAWAGGRAVMLLAAGGMGKSRLLEAFVQGRPGTLRLRARPGDANQPYATLAHALDQALAHWGAALDPGTRAELSRLLPAMGPPPAVPAQQPRLWQAVEQAWLACMARGLQAVVLDDLHWSDTATLEQLRWQLASRPLAALRWAFATRPDEATPATALLRGWFGDSLRVQPVPLRAWSLDELGELLPTLDLPAALAGDPALPATLLRQTGGQPFFVLETLKTAALAGGGPAAALAPAVGAMIERRLQRLGDDARRLLQLLAVAAGELRLQAAARVLQRPPVALADDWAELAAAQLVHATGVAHDLVRECVLATLPAPALRALHLALAEGLAAEPGSDPAALAPHWQAAQAWPQAGAAWRMAAAAAVRAGRLAEADALYDRAAAAHECSGDERAEVEVVAAAHPTRTMLRGAEAQRAALQSRLDTIHDPAARVRLLLLLADAEMSRMQPAAAAAATTLAWRLVQGLPEAAALHADAAMEHGRALAWSDRIDEGVALLRQACAEADATGDLRLRLRARCSLNDVLVPAGQRVESVLHQQEALALTRQLGDSFETAVCASNLSVVQLLVGNAEGAYTAGREALEAFAGMQAKHVNRIMCAGSFAFAAAHLGRFDEVQQLAQPLAEGSDDDPVRRAVRNVLSTIALWRGRPDEAAALMPPPDDTSPLSVRLTGLLARLRWCAWTGADDAADRAALQALGECHPALRDDAHYYRSWALWDPPDDALARLDRLAASQDAAGATHLATSLAAVALQIALAAHRPDAGARALALQAGGPLSGRLHPALYPPEMLAVLASGLRAAGDAAGARTAQAQALAWIDAARLPDGSAATRAAFRRGNPVNRELLEVAAGAALTRNQSAPRGVLTTPPLARRGTPG